MKPFVIAQNKKSHSKDMFDDTSIGGGGEGGGGLVA